MRGEIRQTVDFLIFASQVKKQDLVRGMGGISSGYRRAQGTEGERQHRGRLVSKDHASLFLTSFNHYRLLNSIC